MNETKQFLYRIQPTRVAMLTEGPTEEEQQRAAEHFAYLKELTDQGTVILAGRTLTGDADSFGIVILSADSDAEAIRIMNADPAVKHGVMRGELFPFGVALMGRGPEG